MEADTTIKTARQERAGRRRIATAGAVLLVLTAGIAPAHIVPPEDLDPAVESYRRATFMLNLNPVPWDDVAADVRVISDALIPFDPAEAGEYAESSGLRIRSVTEADEPPGYSERRAAAAGVFEICTRGVSRLVIEYLNSARAALNDHATASASLARARRLWAAFEHEIRATDREAHRGIGRAWLDLSGSLGTPGVLDVGRVRADTTAFNQAADVIIAYLLENFGEDFSAPAAGRLEPLPRRSPTFDAAARVPVRLPPGADINKQLPRPRQILGMASRGVDESETPLIALGDMAFDSPWIFGEPARSLQISCNTCHNKSMTNPRLFIPGLSARGGGMDVSNSFFAPHANNAAFDHLDTPDLRGIRFTAPYGRNGRFASLREFVRNVIVNEFNGPEPEPMLLDGIIAYMNEFEFLDNPALDANGGLTSAADEAARRGEVIFNREYASMGGQSCASCHIPSANFLDHRRHDIGTVTGYGDHSRDRALDTPTLLSARFTPPYFHDGSQPTLHAVNEWFNKKFELGLTGDELADLTAYVEAVSGGTDAYEDTIYTLEAELEEFSFFLSPYELLRDTGREDLIATTFQTIRIEIGAHKWDAQDVDRMPILDRMEELMGEAYEAVVSGRHEDADRIVAEYRRTYEENAEYLK